MAGEDDFVSSLGGAPAGGQGVGEDEPALVVDREEAEADMRDEVAAVLADQRFEGAAGLQIQFRDPAPGRRRHPQLLELPGSVQARYTAALITREIVRSRPGS